MHADCIHIKGTINGLVIWVNREADLADLKTELENKIAARPGFFLKAKFKVYGNENINSAVFEELENLCVENGMIKSEEIYWHQNSKSHNDNSHNAANEITAAQNEIAASHVEKNLYNDSTEEDTLLINKNLRSGQRLFYPGNLVILGDVNPGAEVCAGGDIIVMGCLRGIAHAGATGNNRAIILAYYLEPTQLRIANKITRPPEKDLGPKQPELARLSEDQMVIEPYRSQKINWDVIA